MGFSIPSIVGAARIRHLTVADCDAYIALERDPDVKRFVGGPNLKTDDELRADLASYTPRFTLMAIADVQSDAYIGKCGLLTDVSNPSQSEMYCFLAKTHWRLGIGRSVFLLLARLASLEGAEPVALVHPSNQPSRRLLESIGFISRGPVSSIDGYKKGHLLYVSNLEGENA